MIGFDIELLNDRTAKVRFTDATEGDFAIARPESVLRTARTKLSPYPWTWLRQVHGADVVVVERPGDHAGSTADAAITALSGATLAVQTADCVPIILVGDEGVVAAVHAGWRGATAGVIDVTVAAMRSMTTGSIEAFVGPAIAPECYEFGTGDLAAVAETLGQAVRATSAEGRPALDLVSGLISRLEALDVAATNASSCTACTGNWNSFRARRDRARQVGAVWIEETR